MSKAENRQVTERDLRAPEYREGEPSDYEFRSDGKVVRKDRWERGIREIKSVLRDYSREFEINDIVDRVDALVKAYNNWDDWEDHRDLSGVVQVIVKLEDGSILHNVTYTAADNSWTWAGQPVPKNVVEYAKVRLADTE